MVLGPDCPYKAVGGKGERPAWLGRRIVMVLPLRLARASPLVSRADDQSAGSHLVCAASSVNSKPRTRHGARAHCMHPLHSHTGGTLRGRCRQPRPRRLSTLLQRSFGLRRLPFRHTAIHTSHGRLLGRKTLWTSDLLAGSALPAALYSCIMTNHLAGIIGNLPLGCPACGCPSVLGECYRENASLHEKL